jgi:hypothetical protein
MGKAVEAYTEGFAKGQKDGIAGNLKEAVVGLLRDDPTGYFVVGYQDGGAGDIFNPPSEDDAEAAKE